MALEQNNSLEEEQTRQALDTLIAIQQTQLEELKQLQGKPEAIELYFSGGYKDYETVIQKAGEDNPKVLKLYQQSQKDSPEPSVLGEAKTEAQEQYTPEERARLRTRAKQQEIFTKIFQAIESDLNKEEKTRLKQVMEEQIAKI